MGRNLRQEPCKKGAIPAKGNTIALHRRLFSCQAKLKDSMRHLAAHACRLAHERPRRSSICHEDSGLEEDPRVPGMSNRCTYEPDVYRTSGSSSS